MKFRTKLMIELGVLFILVVFLATANDILINRMTEEAQRIIHENNASLGYCSRMLQSLDGIMAYHQRQYIGSPGTSPVDPGHQREYELHVRMFEDNLKAEESNITEVSEDSVVKELRAKYTAYHAAFDTIRRFSRFDAVTFYTELAPRIENMRREVHQIHEINVAASNFKSNRPYEIANRPLAWIQTVGPVCAIFALIIWMIAAQTISARNVEPRQ